MSSTGNATGSLEQEVIAFTAEIVGDDKNKISLQTMLGKDLGLDGDDAVEFFEAFRSRFNVDLTDLNSHWDEHFGPEGGAGCLSTVAGFLFFALGVVINRFIPVLPVWLSGVVLFIVWLWPLRCWPAGSHGTQVDIQDLVDAARAGRWTKQYRETLLPR